MVRLLYAKRPISKGLRIQVRPCSPSRSQARDRLLAWTDLPPYFLPFLSPLLFSSVLYGNKITEIPKGLFDGLVSLQLL